MLLRKKSASSSPLSWTFTNALLLVGLTLAIVSSSFKIVSVDAQSTTSLQEFFPTTTEDDGEGEDGEGEDGEGEGSPLRVALVRSSFKYATYQQN